MGESYSDTKAIDRVQDYLYSLEDMYLRGYLKEPPNWALIEQNSEFMRALCSRGTGEILERSIDGQVLRQQVTKDDERAIEYYSLLRNYSYNARKGLTRLSFRS